MLTYQSEFNRKSLTFRLINCEILIFFPQMSLKVGKKSIFILGIKQVPMGNLNVHEENKQIQSSHDTNPLIEGGGVLKGW